MILNPPWLIRTPLLYTLTSIHTSSLIYTPLESYPLPLDSYAPLPLSLYIYPIIPLYSTSLLTNTHLLLLNPLHAYTRPYKLISLYKYVPIYPNPSTFVVGPPRGTVEVITRHVLPYTCQYATKQFSKKFIPSINPYIYITIAPPLYYLYIHITHPCLIDIPLVSYHSGNITQSMLLSYCNPLPGIKK